MIGADIVRALFQLRAAEPFDRLGESELLLIARHTRYRAYAPGAILIEGGSAAEKLFVTVEGHAETATGPLPAMFDAPSILFGLAVRADHRAGPKGLGALILAKPHVFTIARECPDFIVGLLEMGARG